MPGLNCLDIIQFYSQFENFSGVQTMITDCRTMVQEPQAFAIEAVDTVVMIRGLCSSCDAHVLVCIVCIHCIQSQYPTVKYRDVVVIFSKFLHTTHVHEINVLSFFNSSI